MNLLKLENLLLIAAALLGLNNAAHSAERPYWISGVVNSSYKFHFNSEGAAMFEKLGQKTNVTVLIDGREISGIQSLRGHAPILDGVTNDPNGITPLVYQIWAKIKREHSGDKTFQNWRNNVLKGTTDRKTVTIIENEKSQINLFHCWPSNYQPPKRNSLRQGEPAFESIDLVCEEWKFS